MAKKIQYVWIDEFWEIYSSRTQVKLIESKEQMGRDLFSEEEKLITQHLIERPDRTREWVDNIYNSEFEK